MIKEIIFKITFFCSIFFYFSPIYAADISIYPDKKELLITVMHGKNEGEGHLEIKNNSAKDIILEVKAFDLTHNNKEKDRVAALSFISTKGEKSNLNIRLGKDKAEVVVFRVSKIDIPGVFTGKIEVKTSAKPVRTLFIKAIKFESQPIDLVEAKDGKLELKMDRPDRKNFHISLKNPGKIFRKIEVQDLILKDNGKAVKGEVLTEKPVTLEPGETRIVTIFFSEIPKGNYEGVFVIKDEYTYQEFDVLLNSPYIPLKPLKAVFKSVFKRELIFVFLLVFAGAIASIMLTKSMPIASEKKKNRERIIRLQGLIKSLTAFEPKLKVKFTVELVRAKTLNDNTKIYTPSAAERFKNIGAVLDRLEKQLEAREKISDIYVDIDSRDVLPFSVEEEIRSKLRDADLNLYLDKIDVAEKIREEALQKSQFDKKQFCEELKKNIEAFIKKEYKIADTYISGLIKDLKNNILPEVSKSANKDTLKEESEKKESAENLRQWDLIWQKADIYCNKFLKEPIRDHLTEEEYSAQEKKLIKFIKYGNYDDLRQAIKLCDSLRYGVTEEMIEDALREKNCRLEYHPSDPDINKIVEFELKFDKEELNKSPLKDNFRYIWNFSDKTSKAEGLEVIHYFKRRGLFILVRKWFRRNIIIPIRPSKAIWNNFFVSVEISPVDGKSIIFPGNKHLNVPVKEALEKEYRSGITFLDVVGVTTTLVLSCIISATTTYDETFSFKSLKDILSPFLVGFALDISRDKLMSTSREVLSKLKGESK